MAKRRNIPKSATRVADDQAKCMAWGHQWDDFAPLTRRPSWGTMVSLRCVRCGKERYDTIDSLGALSTRQYVNPDGYAWPKDATKADMKLEVIRRMRAGKANRRLHVIDGGA